MSSYGSPICASFLSANTYSHHSISAGASLSMFSGNNKTVSCCATTGTYAKITDVESELIMSSFLLALLIYAFCRASRFYPQYFSRRANRNTGERGIGGGEVCVYVYMYIYICRL